MILPIKATPKDGYDLFHKGTLAYARIESNGIRIDTDYLRKTQEEIKETVRKGKEDLYKTKFFAKWKRIYHERTKLGSPDQLAHMLYKVYGYKIREYTETGKPKMDESTLSRIDHPFVKKYLEVMQLQSLQTDFLNGLEREVCEGYLHPSFALNLVETFRGSSSDPNFKNFPNRNKKAKKIVRSCFLPRKKRYWVSLDYSGIEVRIAYCYHRDKVMLKYLTDPSRDMHRDMAAQIYQCEEWQVSDAMRHTAKNMFVFPQFYGSFYIDCARDMWNECGMLKIKLLKKDGTEGESVYDHLKKKGIKELGDCDEKVRPRPGTFEAHVKAVEEDFWGRRFKEYTQWKKEWYNAYLRNGEFGMFTGFRVKGSYRRNQVINYPVQGPAFHCLLQSLILIQEEIDRQKMKTLILGDIHDSLENDVPEDELQDFIPMAKEIMVNTIPKMWDWITVPLAIGVEVAEPGSTWSDKKKWVEKNGVWQLKV